MADSLVETARLAQDNGVHTTSSPTNDNERGEVLSDGPAATLLEHIKVQHPNMDGSAVTTTASPEVGDDHSTEIAPSQKQPPTASTNSTAISVTCTEEAEVPQTGEIGRHEHSPTAAAQPRSQQDSMPKAGLTHDGFTTTEGPLGSASDDPEPPASLDSPGPLVSSTGRIQDIQLLKQLLRRASSDVDGMMYDYTVVGMRAELPLISRQTSLAGSASEMFDKLPVSFSAMSPPSPPAEPADFTAVTYRSQGPEPARGSDGGGDAGWGGLMRTMRRGAAGGKSGVEIALSALRAKARPHAEHAGRGPQGGSPSPPASLDEPPLQSVTEGGKGVGAMLARAMSRHRPLPGPAVAAKGRPTERAGSSMGEREVGWASLEAKVVAAVGSHLSSPQDIMAARLACSQWCEAIPSGLVQVQATLPADMDHWMIKLNRLRSLCCVLRRLQLSVGHSVDPSGLDSTLGMLCMLRQLAELRIEFPSGFHRTMSGSGALQALPGVLCTLSQLQALELSGAIAEPGELQQLCGLTGLTSLRLLDLRESVLPALDLGALSLLTDLRDLAIRPRNQDPRSAGCGWDEAGEPEGVGGLYRGPSSCRTADSSTASTQHEGLTDAQAILLGELTSLRSLDFVAHSGKFSATGCASLLPLAALTRLRLTGARAVKPSGIAILGALPGLQSLVLGACGSQGLHDEEAFVATLPHLGSLRALHLTMELVSADTLAGLGPLVRCLTSLELSLDGIGRLGVPPSQVDAALSAIGSITRLRQLRLAVRCHPTLDPQSAPGGPTAADLAPVSLGALASLTSLERFSFEGRNGVALSLHAQELQLLASAWSRLGYLQLHFSHTVAPASTLDLPSFPQLHTLDMKVGREASLLEARHMMRLNLFSLPPSLTNLSLASFNLNARFKGPLPLGRLRRLRLDRAALFDNCFVSWLPHLANLEVLELRAVAGLGEPALLALGGLQKLQALEVSAADDCRSIRGPSFNSVSTLSRLRSLAIHGSHLPEADALMWLGRLPGLQHLHLPDIATIVPRLQPPLRGCRAEECGSTQHFWQ